MVELNPQPTKDAEALAEMHAQAFSHPWNARAMADLLDSGAFAIAEDDGFILVREGGGEAEILTIAVAPHARRKGIGLALIRAAEKALHAHGATSLFLEVAADNKAALALYERAHFEPVAVRPGYYLREGGPPMDAQILRLTLNSVLPFGV